MSYLKRVYYLITCKEINNEIYESNINYDNKLGVYTGDIPLDDGSEYKVCASPLNFNRALRRQIKNDELTKKEEVHL